MNRPTDTTSSREPDDSKKIEELPEPIVERSRWPFPLIWLVPLAAVIASGFYLYVRHKDRGREITIEFADASGVRPDETPVYMHGAQVGQVTAVSVSQDHRHVQVRVQLLGRDRSIGQEGAKFWIVKPEFSAGDFKGLGTIVSGPYIEAVAGEGKDASQFKGLEKPPLNVADGLRVVLHSDRLEKMQVGSEVQFRGLQVGVVQDIRLGSDSTQVNATALIWHHYAPLVRKNSVFWTVSGADVHGGILTNVHVKLGSLQSLISGSVAFASPNEINDPAQDGQEFQLHADPKDEWLKWSPLIDLPGDPPKPGDDPSASDQTQDTKRDQSTAQKAADKVISKLGDDKRK